MTSWRCRELWNKYKPTYISVLYMLNKSYMHIHILYAYCIWYIFITHKRKFSTISLYHTKKDTIIPLCLWSIISSQFFCKRLNSSIYVQSPYNRFTLFCKVLDDPPSMCQILSSMWVNKCATLQQWNCNQQILPPLNLIQGSKYALYDGIQLPRVCFSPPLNSVITTCNQRSSTSKPP